ncbi:hypothetical protein QQP08_024233 [Theobroma cacao]|nr:hypothetical protein QQP08_024233 [Theobroma cacao]
MALSIVRGLLQQYVQSLFNEGIINDQFSHIQHLKMVGRADHFVQLINTYCLNVETILSKLESYIDLPNVDFSNLAALATEIEERSSCIGAEHVRLACLDLMRACDQMQKQNFCQALSWTKNEFAHTRNKLQVLVQWLLNLSALAASNADGAEDYEARSKTAKIECYQVVFLNVQ